MSLILLLLGIVTAAAGVAAVTFGIPINEFSIGTTLIVAGTTALVGGLILIGLSAVVNELGQVAEGLRTRVAPRASLAPSADFSESTTSAAPPEPAANSRPPQAGVAATAPQRTLADAPVSRPVELGSANAASSVDVSAATFARLRSTLPRGERKGSEPSVVADGEEVPLSPNGVTQQPAQQANDPGPPLREPNGTADDRAGAQAIEALKASRLDFLFRSKPLRPAAQPDNFDAFWPADARSGRSADAATQTRTGETRQEPDNGASVQEALTEPPSPEQAGAPAILKSGIVDGMPYTLYADGSIEARLPQGTVRFGSIAELRAHIESNS
jgi:hypothetical protein